MFFNPATLYHESFCLLSKMLKILTTDAAYAVGIFHTVPLCLPEVILRYGDSGSLVQGRKGVKSCPCVAYHYHRLLCSGKS
jgi:hypothetical protein